MMNRIKQHLIVIFFCFLAACGPGKEAIEQKVNQLKSERTSLKLNIKTVQDSLDLIVNSYAACYEAIRYQYGYRKYIEPHYLAYSDSIISSMDEGKAEADALRPVIQEFVSMWEKSDLRIDAGIQKLSQKQISAAAFLDSASVYLDIIATQKQQTEQFQNELSRIWTKVRRSCGLYKTNMNSLISYYRSRKVIP
jgi:hypothetical protein